MGSLLKGIAFVVVLVALAAIRVEQKTAIPNASTYNFTFYTAPLPPANDALRPVVASFWGLTRSQMMAPEGFAHTNDDRFLFFSLMTGAVGGND